MDNVAGDALASREDSATGAKRRRHCATTNACSEAKNVVLFKLIEESINPSAPIASLPSRKELR